LLQICPADGAVHLITEYSHTNGTPVTDRVVTSANSKYLHTLMANGA